MVWIINDKSNRVQSVALGSAEMIAARNVYMTEAEAKAAHRETCKHPTWLGNSSTGAVFCADCGASPSAEGGV